MIHITYSWNLKMSVAFDKAVSANARPLDWRQCSSRDEALNLGLLLDAGEATQASRPNFLMPVHLTLKAWDDCVSWTDQDDLVQVYQHRKGRLHDVVGAAAGAISRARAEKSKGGSYLVFPVDRVPRDGHSTCARRIKLVMVAENDDSGREVVTIMTLAEAEAYLDLPVE